MRTYLMPRIVSVNTSSIDQAARRLRVGEVVAFPTETVYGLGACTLNERAVDRVYELKGRPSNNPLIAHVLDEAMTRTIVSKGSWDARCDALAARFWPGPLTLVLARNSSVPDRATAGRPTIAVRSPAHPVARLLIERTGESISAPSANRSGRVSPTSAHHVLEEFADVPEARDLEILDGGPCEVGIESTVLDLTSDPPCILRPGSVTIEQLRTVIGEVESPDVRVQAASPGTSASHYAPHTPTNIVDSARLREALQQHVETGRRCVALIFPGTVTASPHTPIVMPREPNAYAHDLYRRLREADALGWDVIIIEQPPDDSHLWRAINDRLRRAAAAR